ncbi:AgmX/PglI C-terminal domain-containing protein [Bdellovibrio sp. HCB337]|uniref:AgmX/PglI C-terminal domain-containing protein n=1 Tax=Bdellovibrio sp. HCB337 TaxID=3394358 RepID=UPI0039A75883
MRKTVSIITSLLFSMQVHASETFDLALPEEVTNTNSSGFVNSYEQDLGRKKLPDNYVVTTVEEPAPSPTRVEDESPQGAYSSAFSSFRTKKSSEDSEQEAADAWRKSQEKSDNFDLDNLSFAESAPEPRYEAPPVAKQPYAKSGKSSRVVSRSPASEEIPPPQGVDLGKELESLESSKSSSDSSAAPVSAKERKEHILRTISDNYRDLKTCYHDGLKKKSEMKGKVVMGWAMDAQGRVSGVEVQTSQLHNKDVEKCMVDRLSGWRFPRQAKLASSKDRMTYTFHFVPEKD